MFALAVGLLAIHVLAIAASAVVCIPQVETTLRLYNKR
jgi:hypothetical protein